MELSIEQQRALARARARIRIQEGAAGAPAPAAPNAGPDGNAAPSATDFAGQAAVLSPRDLSIARSKNDAFGAYLREQSSAPKPGETPDQTFKRQYGGLPQEDGVGVGEGIARAALQGGTFGFGDEIVAGGTAALDSIVRGDKFGDAYDARLANERGRLERFRDDHPVLAYGSEIAGAVPTAVAPFLNGPRALTMAQQIGRRLLGGAMTGAGQGALYGFGAGEGSGGERGEEAVLGAVLGGTLGGAVAPAIGSGARAIGERLLAGREAAQTGVSRPVYDILNRAMTSDDSFTGAGAARLMQAGDDAMLADAGPNARTILDTVIQRSGPGSRIAREAIDTRATQAGQRVTQALDDALGAPQGIATAERGLRTGTAAARADAYRAAYSTPIDYASPIGQQIERMVGTRVPRSAINAANALIRTEGDHVPQILAQVGPDGAVRFSNLPSVAQIDYITRGLNEVANRAQGQGALGGTSQVGRAYGNLSRELRSLLRQAVPEYGTALDTAAEPIAAREALQFGRTILSPAVARDQVSETIRGMSAAERGYVAQGLRAQIDETLANVRRALTDANVDARESVKAVKDLSSRAGREKVSALLGDAEARTMFDQIDRAAMALDLRASVADNSRTFARRSMDDIIRSQVDDGVINALRNGEILTVRKEGVLPRLAQTLMGRTEAAKARVADETYSELARLLTGPRGAEAQRLLGQMAGGPSRVDLGAEQARLLGERLLQRSAPVTAPLREELYR